MSDMQQPSSKKARKQTMPGADVCPVNALDALRMFHNHRGNVTGGYMRVLLNALDALPERPASKMVGKSVGEQRQYLLAVDLPGMENGSMHLGVNHGAMGPSVFAALPPQMPVPTMPDAAQHGPATATALLPVAACPDAIGLPALVPQQQGGPPDAAATQELELAPAPPSQHLNSRNRLARLGECMAHESVQQFITECETALRGAASEEGKGGNIAALSGKLAVKVVSSNGPFYKLFFDEGFKPTNRWPDDSFMNINEIDPSMVPTGTKDLQSIFTEAKKLVTRAHQLFSTQTGVPAPEMTRSQASNNNGVLYLHRLMLQFDWVMGQMFAALPLDVQSEPTSIAQEGSVPGMVPISEGALPQRGRGAPRLQPHMQASQGLPGSPLCHGSPFATATMPNSVPAALAAAAFTSTLYSGIEALSGALTKLPKDSPAYIQIEEQLLFSVGQLAQSSGRLPTGAMPAAMVPPPSSMAPPPAAGDGSDGSDDGEGTQQEGAPIPVTAERMEQSPLALLPATAAPQSEPAVSAFEPTGAQAMTWSAGTDDALAAATNV